VQAQPTLALDDRADRAVLELDDLRDLGALGNSLKEYCSF
jgi:hypothetical protein